MVGVSCLIGETFDGCLGVASWKKELKDSSPLDGYLYKYFKSSERVRSIVDPSGLEPRRALKLLASFPFLSLFSLDVKLSLLLISDLLRIVSTGGGVLFPVPPDFLCNRFNLDISLLVAGCETFLSALLDQRLRAGQSAVKRSSAGGSLRFFFLYYLLQFSSFSGSFTGGMTSLVAYSVRLEVVFYCNNLRLLSRSLFQ
jgi:hypothetical protein